MSRNEALPFCYPIAVYIVYPILCLIVINFNVYV
jgi:hypothetical protein